MVLGAGKDERWERRVLPCRRVSAHPCWTALPLCLPPHGTQSCKGFGPGVVVLKGLIPILHVSPAEHGQERKGLEGTVPMRCTEHFRDLQPCQHRSPGCIL